MADNVFKTLKDKFQSTELYKSGYFGLPQDLGGEAEGFDQNNKNLPSAILSEADQEFVDELPKEELTPEGRKSKAKLGTTVKKSSKQRIGRGE